LEKSPVYGVLDSKIHTRLAIVTANELALAFPPRNLPNVFCPDPSTFYLVIVVTNRQTNRQLDRQTYAGDYIIPRESFRGDNKHIYAVHVTVLLCVFSNDDEGKLPIKQITNWTVFGEIQTATTTFIACLTRFRFSPRPFENLHRIPTGPWRFITVSIPIPHPSPLESSSESSYPQQPCQSHTSPSVNGNVM